MTDRSSQINEAERLVAHYEMFKGAAEIIRQAHADEAEIRVREKRLDELQKQNEALKKENDQLTKTKKERLQALEDETKRLEEDQQKRVMAATNKASEAIRQLENQKKEAIRIHRQEIEKSAKQVDDARGELTHVTHLLAEKKKEHEDFVRRIAR
jgi:predicted nuclease with TOPRIM domain